MSVLSPSSLETTDYGAAGWTAILTANMQRLNTYLAKFIHLWNPGSTPDGAQLRFNATSGVWEAVAGVGAPAGSVQTFAMSAPPVGWLKANGAAISRTTYASLFAAIGVIFGSGDGSTTFNLPDLRGEFIRGIDDGRGVDAGRVFGSAQAGAIQSHSHAIRYSLDAAPGAGMTRLNAASELLTYTEQTGAAETRPRNIALLACIKY